MIQNNITDEINMTETPDFGEEDILDLEIQIHTSVEEYLIEYGIDQCQPDFYKTMIDKITEEYLENLICAEIIEEEPYKKIYKRFRKQVHQFVKNYYNIIGIPRRAYQNPRSHHYTILNKEHVRKQLETLTNAKQYAQRTPEWYEFRHNLITASNIWKAIGTVANQNSLILEKCKPYEAIPENGGQVNTDSPLHWGVKYEPLTIMLYEKRNAKIGEFGCICHPKYPFIGASPDGIVINEDSPAYGRMLEIKNVVSREITGIPKMDYWVQIQTQLEVCDLEECDFVETKFKEYEDIDEEEFYKNKHKYLYNGVILYFINSDFADCKPYYVYMPLDIKLEKQTIGAWVDEKKKELKETHVLFKRIYWYCEAYSCVLVKRNRHWFEMALPKMEELWNTILKERVTGYEHRKPKKRVVEKKCLISKLVREEMENNVFIEPSEVDIIV
jgi:putative phage-type endonuclease